MFVFASNSTYEIQLFLCLPIADEDDEHSDPSEKVEGVGDIDHAVADVPTKALAGEDLREWLEEPGDTEN